MKVTLREKKIKDGKTSLYLDFYPGIPNPETGKTTRREFLKMYVYTKPKDDAEREFNKETRIQAKYICLQRQLDVQAAKYNFLRKKKDDTDLVAYFTKIAETKRSSKSNYDTWISALNYLKRFTNEKYALSAVTEKFCNDFKEYLMTSPTFRSSKTKLSKNAASAYFNKFKATLHKAYREGLIDDIASKIDYIRMEDTHREFLSLEELRKLVETDCEIPILKKAALFSAMTGLRISDIKALNWNYIHRDEKGPYIRYTQQKTNSKELLRISDQALELIVDNDRENEFVFPKVNNSAWDNMKLRDWLIEAGITRKITFHCFRHTYATLLLSLDTDIFTISKMLGHRNVKTTQIYAKVVDQKKVEAANKIKL